MSQRERIHDFIKGRMAEMEVSGKQTAIVFGRNERNHDTENFQNEYNCQNYASATCSSNLHKCTNGNSSCGKSTNALVCTNM